MDGYCVQIFVGEDAAYNAMKREVIGDYGMSITCNRKRSFIDGQVFQGSGKLGREVRCKIEDVGGENSCASPELQYVEGRRSAHLVPDVGELDRQQGSECGVGPGAGVEVAFSADGVGAGRIVAESRVIESQLHEAGEGDRAPYMGLFNDQGFQGIVRHKRSLRRLESD